MHLRKARDHELDTIYSIGFEAWSDGLSCEDFLSACKGSKKYQDGVWYVLIENEQILSSLIVYQNLFSLKDDCFGIGSVATPKNLRGKGYASELINLVKIELFQNHNGKAIFLHSDINERFYRRLGFDSVNGTRCMFSSNLRYGAFDLCGSVPTYF
ncbi:MULTISPECIES: GNAT family N-acetyltransferase [Vibrio]|uniref:GNAT family N-acetyltransferase n=1 Tax=Vibrio lentus TaxID=136468 RepID=A0A1B9QKE2_9VIBR|nr:MULTISPECIES: GNAT family N-acetyltransferase [Vibrio]OCH64842.1 acetyltransferase [Vibrio lentus]PME46200.1 GNAT family N-acetyltransferase [Vibrio lentus]PME57879.1 GNAT family N-acetyltransferase [Vibrio lentus]PME78239.1 GNAT family N-acetyltransferase [Vibrio lentus]PMH90311.1 GNAT family N-acetyltransferase [Vibrio lentus]